MGFQVSPGVNTSEIDLTTVVPGISSIDAGLAGPARWGPANDVTLIDSEDLLVQTFQKPDANTYTTFFTAANFLNYASKLHFVRAVSSAAKNASSAGSPVLISNNAGYYDTYDSDSGGTPITTAGDWNARWAGSLGNSLKVSLCGPTRANLASGNTVVASNSDVTLTGTVAVHVSDKSVTGTDTLFGTELRVGDVIQLSGNTFCIATITSNTAATVSTNPATGAISAVACVRMKRSAFAEPSRNMLGTVAVSANVATVTATTAGAEQPACSFNLQYTVGDIIKINGEERRVTAVTNSSSMTVNTGFTNTATAQTHSRTWEYAGSFDKEPVTTDYTASRGGLYDEVHVAVVDEDGEWTGNRNEVLEAYTGVSVAKGAKFEDGGKAFYLDRINRRSKYVWWMDHNVAGDAYTTAGASVAAWGADAGASEWQSSGDIVTASLTGGVDGSDVTDGNKMTSYGKFKNAEETEIGLLMGGESSATVALELISIVEARKDCVAFISPEKSDVVNNVGGEADAVVDFRNSLGSTSYALLDSGWKYQYDRYNDVYRYIPLNGDTAGVTAATEASRDAWFSPAGFTRGNIRNVVKLPFNPRQSERDTLYKNNVNPVTTFMGTGTVLFGDKTLLAKPSAFDRINVRRLFIILEKAISRFARFQLFEFNDAFTRAQFVGAVEPFLRNVQGRDGIVDFKVVCDDSNNTSDVVDRNEFVGDIYVKPNRVINYIQLNFVAVRTGVDFSEIIG
tara:strand:+ start:703 stop:2913 length:2211 start_codon:yes stop_codon:yes gene_type:complete